MRAIIFDLDGTLVDSVYAHVLAWQRVLEDAGMLTSCWRVHRLIGMSGGLLTRAAAHETGRDISDEEAEALQTRHGALYKELLPVRHPLPGAVSSCGICASRESRTASPPPESAETSRPP